MRRKNHKLHLVPVVSPSCGNGKSTLALALAMRLCAMGRRVVLIDTSLNQGLFHICRNAGIQENRKAAHSGIGKFLSDDCLDWGWVRENALPFIAVPHTIGKLWVFPNQDFGEMRDMNCCLESQVPLLRNRLNFMFWLLDDHIRPEIVIFDTGLGLWWWSDFILDTVVNHLEGTIVDKLKIVNNPLVVTSHGSGKTTQLLDEVRLMHTFYNFPAKRTDRPFDELDEKQCQNNWGVVANHLPGALEDLEATAKRLLREENERALAANPECHFVFPEDKRRHFEESLRLITSATNFFAPQVPSLVDLYRTTTEGGDLASRVKADGERLLAALFGSAEGVTSTNGSDNYCKQVENFRFDPALIAWHKVIGNIAGWILASK